MVTFSDLKRNSHTIDELKDLVVKNCQRRGKDLSPLQQNALKDFQNERIFDLRYNNEFARAEILGAYFRLFDDLFFGRAIAIHGYTKLLVHHEERRKRDPLGMSAGKIGWRLSVRRVEIHVWDEGRRGSRLFSLLDQLSTLLHEMVHALFMLYSEHSLMKHTSGKLGGSGHGEAWAAVARAVQVAAREEEGLRLMVELDIVEGRDRLLFRVCRPRSERKEER